MEVAKVLAPLVAALAAAPPGSFAALKERAVAVERPASWLESLAGPCDARDMELRLRCQERRRRAVRESAGKLVYIDLGSGHQELLEFAALSGERARFVWVPMYAPGNGLAITFARPRRLDARGWPVLPRRPIEGRVPPGTLRSDLARLARLGQVNVEVVARVGRPWTMRRRGRVVRGVAMRLVGVRLSHARTGATLLERVY